VNTSKVERSPARRRRIAITAVVTVIASISLAACSGLAAEDDPASSSSSTYTTLLTGQEPTDVETAALASVPESVRDAYAGFWHSTRLGPNPYADWEAPGGPWKFCYSSSYQGNSWRVEGVTVAENIVAQLDEQGLVDGELLVTDANNDAGLQATQIVSLADKGCDVIFVMQPPTVGVCQAIDSANEAGALVVVMQTGTDCTNVIQSDFAEYQAAAVSAQWLVDKTGGTGTIVMCEGIPGVAAGEARNAGAESVFAEAGMTVDTITGQWTPSTVKAEMLKYLGTNQDEVTGVWEAGVCAVAVTQAFEQAGRDLPYITGFEGSCAWLANWEQTGKESIAFTQSAGQGVVEAFKIALRMLAGQKPAFNTLLYPLPQIDASNFDTYYDPAMTLESACNAQPVDGESTPDSYYDALFTGGGEPATFEPGLNDLPIN
jgi:ribose transport system substrate-binding protein